MNDLRIAVIVPVLDEEAFLTQHIAQFKALQKHAVVMFCDGGSGDKTCSLLQQYNISYCCSPRGRAGQMNTGSRACDSDIILFIHADTIIDAAHIQAIQEAMRIPSVVGGRFDVHLSGNPRAFRIIEYMINLRSRLTGVSTGDQCQFVRRRVFEAMGGFPDQALMEDVEFSKRLKRLGKIACLRDKVMTSSRRWEQMGIGKTVMLMWKMRLLYWLGASPESLSEMYRNVR